MSFIDWADKNKKLVIFGMVVISTCAVTLLVTAVESARAHNIEERKLKAAERECIDGTKWKLYVVPEGYTVNGERDGS
ncbi:hypothetical protein [Methylobacillus sp.]|uniref:hypothetical protein n=1 Tax=Methylobacillus sp. TaxID=56818 RepID=UPI0012C9FC6F|nr:hypothetical protein [Methylobacillus sp.]MPS48515.1 hypothetical protein [Methylobacillus sp.]